MPRRSWMVSLLLMLACNVYGSDLSGIEIHGFATQGFVYSSQNNYLTMRTSTGSFQWTDGALSISDSITDKLRIGVQFHIYQLGQLGGARLQVDWASGDYRVNDHLGFRAGKVKSVLGLFNDSQDVDAVFLWILLPQSTYPIDNKSFFLSHLGGEVYGELPLGSRDGKIRYRGYAGQADLDLHGGYVKQAADGGVVYTDPPGGKIYGADLRWEGLIRGLTLGSSARVQALAGSTRGTSVYVPPTFINAQYAQFESGRFYFAGEYQRFPLDTQVTLGPFVVRVPQDARSWFVMANYRLMKRVHAGSYYSHYVNKALNTALPENYSKDFVLSARYDFNSYFYSKIEGHFIHGTGLGYYASTNPVLRPNTGLLAAKIGFTF